MNEPRPVVSLGEAGLQEAPVWVERVLAPADWLSLEQGHLQRLSGDLDAYVRRRAAHHKDPVLDFLFEYYRFRPAQLKRWSPGFGALLKGEEAARFLSHSGYEAHAGGVTLDPSRLPHKRWGTIRWIATLLSQTASRPPSYGCYGMHEWAMVYKAEAVRHESEPLRLSPEAIAAFVESRPLRCTHFDAWRFFTAPAKPMNRFTLSRDNQEETEQPGCLHANMDLYKWAYKLFPWVGSELLADAFMLARRARLIDMQASPYDLRERGILPIEIETEEGRQRYQAEQRALTEAADGVRRRLLEVCQALLRHSGEA